MNKTEEDQYYISFTKEDLKLFSLASHDRNPLHLSESYSRKTPYGQPVVFGVLCGIASLGCLPKRVGYIASSIDIEFLGPIFLGVNYRVEIQQNVASRVGICVFDGKRHVVKLSIKYREPITNETQLKEISGIPEIGKAPRVNSNKIDTKELEKGVNVKGSYTGASEAYKKLEDQYDLMDIGISESQYTALMFCSYLVGMELPGTDALFSQLKIDFNNFETYIGNSFSYNVHSEYYDKRINLLKIGGTLSVEERQYATIQLTSFVRQPVTFRANTPIVNNFNSSDLLLGKVALVTGASRGLGASIAGALVTQGCTVFANYHNSQEDAESLKEYYSTANGSLILVRGDICDIDYCERLKRRILNDYGKLDFLILNATPPLLPLLLETTSLSRIHDFLMKSVSMASVPMAVFNTLLSEYGGQQVFISSSAVREATADWPHYVAAKSAIEGLIRSAAAEYPNVKFTIARFKRLLTDLTNTPLGRKGALSPAIAASKLVKSITSPITVRGEVNILDMNDMQLEKVHY